MVKVLPSRHTTINAKVQQAAAAGKVRNVLDHTHATHRGPANVLWSGQNRREPTDYRYAEGAADVSPLPVASAPNPQKPTRDAGGRSTAALSMEGARPCHRSGYQQVDAACSDRCPQTPGVQNQLAMSGGWHKCRKELHRSICKRTKSIISRRL